MVSKKWLSSTAIYEAGLLRRKVGIDIIDPVNMYDLVETMGIELRFKDLPSLEGMYFKSNSPLIVISSLRPLGRKSFTIGHELGHHHFDHGDTIDEILEDSEAFQPREYIADVFAGYLLMPKIAICNTCYKRGWNLSNLDKYQLFKLSCYFGVGFSALINNMMYTAKVLSEKKQLDIGRLKVSEIKQSIIGETCRENLMIIDEFWRMENIDIEVGDFVILPAQSQQIREVGFFYKSLKEGNLFKMNNIGIENLTLSKIKSVNVRVMKKCFVGRNKYRNLKEIE